MNSCIPKYKMSEMNENSHGESPDFMSFHGQNHPDEFDFENGDCHNAIVGGSQSSCMNNSSRQQQQKSIYTIAAKTHFNIEAPPFEMPLNFSSPKIKIGPSEVEVNSKIWSTIASNRPLPHLQRMPQLSIATPAPPPSPVFQQNYPQMPMVPAMGLLNAAAAANNNIYNLNGGGYNNTPPLFENDYTRSFLFTRNFGPVANMEGYVEFRLKEEITIFISLDRSILIRNPKAKVSLAVSHDLMCAAMEHSNGKVYQATSNTVDMILYDSSKKMNNNNVVRYAKMWEKGVSLTADGCALTYLVDNAGSRTTSDAVNKDYMTDYALKVFTDNSTWGPHLFHDAENACNAYHFSTQKDGTYVFDILGYRITQTSDGMVQVSRPNNRLKIHTSPSNGSARISTPFTHATASMGRSTHMFVRHEERRMHFDGVVIVVRNQGHSAGFDEENNLRIY